MKHLARLCLLALLALPCIALADDHEEAEPAADQPLPVEQAGPYEIEDGEIVRVEIISFNWESHSRTIYTVTDSDIRFTPSREDAQPIETALSDEQAQATRALIDRIDTAYNGFYSNERVSDGVVIIFRFYFEDGRYVQTWLSNVMVDDYAALTRHVSLLADPDIHYHQERYAPAMIPIEEAHRHNGGPRF